MLPKPEPFVKPDMIFSVSDASALLKNVVETAFPVIKIRGELSQITRATSGHMYMTIKDTGAAISAIIWRGTPIPFQLADGLEVIVSGKFTTYPARSNYQIIVNEIEMAGAGAILKMLEERKQKLAAEGLFDAARKRALPRFPSVIGIVTSPTGAAFQDICNRLRERFPVTVLLYPAQVQGATAAAEVVAGIKYFNGLPKSDIIYNVAADWFPSYGGVAPEGPGWSFTNKSSVYFNLPFNPDLVERAKELRKAGSLPEALFWTEASGKKINGLDFDRQKIIGNYIVDFFCPETGVVIEIDDAASHDWKGEYDERRHKYLESFGLEIIHISAKDVLKNMNDVLEMLTGHPKLQKTTPPASPAPLHRRGTMRPEVIIVARGGGSLEDLLPFSEEIVVRAVAASEIPVVSGVGHEPDWMLIDFAADVRAPTPTGAAEIVVPTKISILTEIENLSHRLAAAYMARLKNMNHIVSGLSIKSPKQMIMERAQRLDDIGRTMQIIFINKLNASKTVVSHADRLPKLLENRLATARQSLSHIDQMLNSLSYKNVLQRGFAIVRHDNKIVSNAADFAVPAEIEFADGTVKI
jgi:exonuclease VII large subunit/very-short-patch-repair endonuclease